MKKILILGAAGMAGHVIYTHLTELGNFEIIGTTNSNNFDGITDKVDVFDIQQVERFVKDVKPHIVINCVGMLLQSAKNNPDRTIYANSYFPHALKRIANDHRAKVIHISTDCVFSGKEGKYTERSFKNATDIYGMSKSLGEINDDFNLTIRTSIIGPEIKEIGEGLFDWFMRQNGEINGFRSNIWSGVTTLELAKFIDWVIENERVGLVHLTNNIPISKFDLLTLINTIYSKGLVIKCDKDYVADKSLINTDETLLYSVPSYQKMLEEQLEMMKRNQQNYSKYF